MSTQHDRSIVTSCPEINRQSVLSGISWPVVDSDDNTISEAVLTDYSEDGVDLTLIRWMLSLTPDQRLQFLEEPINEVLTVRQLNAGNQTSFNPTKPL